MTILRMCATFGKLDGAILECKPGLNVITASNEAGKSTWCAFLLAMFYGIDTSQRSRRSVIADKVRYLPWNGKPMSGRVDLLWNRRYITIERTSAGKAPMGTFQAYETKSGQPVEELTSQNCGQMLLGVPKAVYERSAFVRQAGQAVTPDASLQQRLHALVTTGQETVCFDKTKQQLQELRNRCQHNKTGLIPQQQVQLEEVAQKLEQRAALEQENDRFAAGLQQLLLQQQALQGQLDRQKRQAVQQAQQTAAQKQAYYQALLQRNNPSDDRLESWKSQWDQLEQDWQEAVLPESTLPPPKAPGALAGLNKKEAQQRITQHREKLESLEKRPGIWLWALGVLLAAAAAFLAVRQQWLGLVGCVVALLAAALCYIWKKQQRYRAGQALLQAYGVHTYQEFAAATSLFLQQLEPYEAQIAADRCQRQAAQERYSKLQQQRQALQAQMAAYWPRCTTVAACREHLLDAQNWQAQLDLAKQDARQAAQYVQILQQGSGTSEGTDASALTQQLAQLQEKLLQLQQQKYLNDGRMCALGDPAQLLARQRGLQERLQQLQQYFDALGFALHALEEANSRLQTRFAPQLTQQAGRYLQELTGGRYNRLYMDAQLNLQLQQPETLLSQDSGYFSCGTQDQIYLALRLAIAEMLLMPDTPFVLDDALVSFDDARLVKAMALLQRQGQQRQILLFSCQKREEQLLKQM